MTYRIDSLSPDLALEPGLEDWRCLEIENEEHFVTNCQINDNERQM